jgi:hypothetical protein
MSQLADVSIAETDGQMLARFWHVGPTYHEQGDLMLIRIVVTAVIIAGVAFGHSGQSIAQVAGQCGVYAKANKCQAYYNRQQQQCVCIGK